MEPVSAELERRIFLTDEQNFADLCLEVFRFQYAHNPLYRSYCNHLNRSPAEVNHLQEIPFLPIRTFKEHAVKTTEFEAEAVFESSGTTGTETSRHYVKHLQLYQTGFTKGFKQFFGEPSNYVLLALLPSYLERENSSLVYMVNHLMKQSGYPANGSYLYEHDELAKTLQQCKKNGTPTILFGVTYALLDFAEAYAMDLSGITVVETGGMKGRKKEMVREAVHEILCEKWNVQAVASEYGMTELLSQAWSTGNGLFNTPPWMRVFARLEDDPLTMLPENEPGRGVANIIDLANLYSCSFIATDDLVKISTGKQFEILGRRDHSDLRGCNLLVV